MDDYGTGVHPKSAPSQSAQTLYGNHALAIQRVPWYIFIWLPVSVVLAYWFPFMHAVYACTCAVGYPSPPMVALGTVIPTGGEEHRSANSVCTFSNISPAGQIRKARAPNSMAQQLWFIGYCVHVFEMVTLLAAYVAPATLVPRASALDSCRQSPGSRPTLPRAPV